MKLKVPVDHISLLWLGVRSYHIHQLHTDCHLKTEPVILLLMGVKKVTLLYALAATSGKKSNL